MSQHCQWLQGILLNWLVFFFFNATRSNDCFAHRTWKCLLPDDNIGKQDFLGLLRFFSQTPSSGLPRVIWTPPLPLAGRPHALGCHQGLLPGQAPFCPVVWRQKWPWARSSLSPATSQRWGSFLPPEHMAGKVSACHKTYFLWFAFL